MKITHHERARAHFLASAEVKRKVAEVCLDATVEAAERVARCLQAGNKVMFCGNGGSAADSQHLAAELTNRLNKDFERPPLAGLALTTDSSFLTSNANDYGYVHVFERQIQALGKAGDMLIGITTTGNSKNVIRAVEACKKQQIGTIGFLGGGGGEMGKLVDVAIVVPHDSTQHVQECHIAIGHVLCGIVEQIVFAGTHH